MKRFMTTLTVLATGVFLMTGLLSCASPPESADLIITNARVIDGTGTVYNRAVIVITGERIQSIASGETQLSAGMIIDVQGKTVLPGLIDAHVHLLREDQAPVDDQTLAQYITDGLPAELQAYLSHGVTTIKSTGDIVEPFLQVRDSLARGEMLGPRLFLVGPVLTAHGGHPAATLFRGNPWRRARQSKELTTETEARTAVRQLSELGVDAIKFVYQGSVDEKKPYLFGPGISLRKITPQIMKAIIDETHTHQLRVTAHTMDLEDAMAVLEAGSDGLEHGVARSQVPDDKLGTLLLERGASYVPTLITRRPNLLKTAMANLKQLADQGVRIVLGTDTPVGGALSGLTTLKELELMVQAGMSPEQVIQAATRNAAQHLGKLDEFGTLEAGKLADLIIVEGDPLMDITVMHNIEVVIKGGKVVVDNRGKD